MDCEILNADYNNKLLANNRTEIFSTVRWQAVVEISVHPYFGMVCLEPRRLVYKRQMCSFPYDP